MGYRPASGRTDITSALSDTISTRQSRVLTGAIIPTAPRKSILSPAPRHLRTARGGHGSADLTALQRPGRIASRQGRRGVEPWWPETVMNSPLERLVCPKCGGAVRSEDVRCTSCQEPLETVLIKRATRGRRYVYGKRKTGLSPEVIWLLVVILLGLLIIVGTQLLAFMRSRKLVEAPRPAAVVAAVPMLPAGPGGRGAGAEALRGHRAGCPEGQRTRRCVTLHTPRGRSHEARLRHLCHADRPAGGHDPGPGGHRVGGDRDLCRAEPRPRRPERLRPRPTGPPAPTPGRGRPEPAGALHARLALHA